MAHQLHIENGKASMMYVGEAPWHGLGTHLNQPATAAQAISAAGLDWEVVKKPLVAFDGKVTHPVPEHFAVIRKDWVGQLRPVFGVVGEGYTPLQNREAFGFFDPIVSGPDAAIYHTAGALGNGERIWLLAKLPNEMLVVGDDIAHKYLLLSNSHDGSSAVQIKFTPIRVVCQNTLTMALSRGRTLRVPHVSSLRARMTQAADLLGLVQHEFTRIETSFKAMVGHRMNKQQAEAYLKAVFPDPSDAGNADGFAKARANRIWSMHFFENGAGTNLPNVAGTLWATYNGVAEFVDHRQPASGTRKPGPGCSRRRRSRRRTSTLVQMIAACGPQCSGRATQPRCGRTKRPAGF